MPEDSPRSYQEVLSPDEIKSITDLQNAYSADTKKAAFDFAETIGLPEDVRETVVGYVAVRLNDMDFEQRREAGEKFRNLNDTLGQAAVRPTLQETKSLVTSNPKTDTQQESPRGDDELVPMGKKQKAWVNSLYEDNQEAADKVISLDGVGRDLFIHALTETYKALPIKGVNASKKEIRSEQIRLFLDGQNFTEIAKSYGVGPSAARSNILNLSNTLKRLVPEEDLLGFIPFKEV